MEAKTWNWGDAVLKYRKLRALKKQKDDAHKEDVKKVVGAMEAIERAMKSMMKEQGQTSVNTDHGVAFMSNSSAYSVDDKRKFREFVIDEIRCKGDIKAAFEVAVSQATGTDGRVDTAMAATVFMHRLYGHNTGFESLDYFGATVKQDAVKEFVDQYKRTPPGIKRESWQEVKVNKPNNSAKKQGEPTDE